MIDRGLPSYDFGKKRLTKRQAAMVKDNLGLCYMMMTKNTRIPHWQLDEKLAEVALPGLIRATRSYDPAKGSFATYACWAIRTSIISYYRKLKREAQKATVRRIDDMPILADTQSLPPARLLSKEAGQILARLSPRSRLIMELRHYNKLTYREIGERVGMSLQGVRSAERAILKRLRETYGIDTL